MGSPSAREYGADHGLHVSSGTAVLPERVYSLTAVEGGFAARQLSVPHVATVSASRTSDVKVPRVAWLPDSRNSFPGFADASHTLPFTSFKSDVTCCASALAMRATRTGSPVSRYSLPLAPVATRSDPFASGNRSYGTSSLDSHTTSETPSGRIR